MTDFLIALGEFLAVFYGVGLIGVGVQWLTKQASERIWLSRQGKLDA